MKIQFIGATEDVTGSMTLVSNSLGMLLVDCGLYQGTSEVVKKNREPLTFDPREIKAIILTHAHLDHSGFIPRLIKLGFRGDIFCTKATMKLAKLIMSDSAKILQKNESHPLHSFYETEDAMIATSLFKIKSYHEVFEVLGMKLEFFSAGHILGAASVVIKGEKTIVFSGDLGRDQDPINEAPEKCPAAADIIVMESTYGGTIRKSDMEEDLKRFLKKVKNESKVGIVASFAVARAQLLITLIHQHYLEHPEDKVRLVIDGPMMVEANKIYKEFSRNTKMAEELKFSLDNIEIIDQTREWESIQKQEGPLIVITSSGMVSGGRVWRYLENWQDDDTALLFLPGYQGVGTPGKMLSEGKRIVHDEEGKTIHWRGEVMTSDAFSSHADQNELVGWLKDIRPETQIYLIHGEGQSKLKLKEKLESLGFKHVEIAQGR